VNPIILVDPHQQTGTEERNQGCRLQLIARTFYEALHLARRLTSSPLNVCLPAVTEIGGIQLANSVIGEARAFADSARTGFVPNHPESQLKLAALP